MRYFIFVTFFLCFLLLPGHSYAHPLTNNGTTYTFTLYSSSCWTDNDPEDKYIRVTYRSSEGEILLTEYYTDWVCVMELVDEVYIPKITFVANSDLRTVSPLIYGISMSINEVGYSFPVTDAYAYWFNTPLQEEGPVEPTPTPVAQIITDPSSSSVTVGTPFNVNVKVANTGEAFNAVRATVAVSSNLAVLGIHTPSSNACSLQYTKSPTKADPSFAGAIYGSASTGCTVYTLTLRPKTAGTGTVTISNGSIKAYEDNSELLTGVENASFDMLAGPTPTQGQVLQFSITSPQKTYATNYTLSGTKLGSITGMYANGTAIAPENLTETTWEQPVTLANAYEAYSFVLYGSDGTNQTATKTVQVTRHNLGDINGDQVIDLIDASLFAIDWDKTAALTYNLSDMNGDTAVDLTDLSILAKLQ